MSEFQRFFEAIKRRLESRRVKSEHYA